MPYIVSTGLILLVSSIFIPFPAVMFIQDMLFFSYDHLSFVRLTSTYFSFGVGMVWIALVLFSFLLTKRHAEKKGKKYKLTALHFAFLLFGFLMFVLSIYHYYYLDENGAHSNSFWTVSETSIAWTEVEEVSRVVKEDDYRVLSYTFKNDEKSVTIPYKTEDTDTAYTIKSVVENYGWEVEDNFTAE
ncbi:hypothetical protein CEY16_06450 [Halalkalibacillus sediminis]|uniref:DUF5673 domain-containing protein n=2 Tax=Halalkalibacillus sediminis TaxID=2018042 RepID=A0A2I0QUX2_9BACI|nr:hypothetical protein CEY16_06450 [Halalkalibacillus sediminis]